MQELRLQGMFEVIPGRVSSTDGLVTWHKWRVSMMTIFATKLADISNKAEWQSGCRAAAMPQHHILRITAVRTAACCWAYMRSQQGACKQVMQQMLLCLQNAEGEHESSHQSS